MYATRADIEAVYGLDLLVRLSDRDLDDAPDETAIEAALKDAAALIDGYISAVYALPLAFAPPILMRPAVDIAVYHLAASDGPVTEQIENRYKEAVKTLERISKGLIKLPVDKDGDGRSEHGRAVILQDGPERRFSRETLKDL